MTHRLAKVISFRGDKRQCIVCTKKLHRYIKNIVKAFDSTAKQPVVNQEVGSFLHFLVRENRERNEKEGNAEKILPELF